MNEASTPVTQRLWGARFKSEPSAALKALSRSEASFFRLVPYDLAGSRAHARELQRAGILQAVELDQLLLAYAQAVGRNIDRLIDWDRRSARSPLGAAALAGSAICRSPELSAAELGYDAPCENSIDAVAARDHVCEFLFITGMLAVELSRLSEEVVLWASRQFQWVTLDDAYCTGSSIMPQKKNPDI